MTENVYDDSPITKLKTILDHIKPSTRVSVLARKAQIENATLEKYGNDDEQM